jgi:hypothetical protein
MSGTDNSGGGGGNNNSGGGGGGGGNSSSAPNIPSLTAGMQQLGNSGKPDTKLSPETRDAYVNAAQLFELTILEQLIKVEKLGMMGSPGARPSAVTTWENLTSDIYGLDGVSISLQQYANYLGEFVKTVQSACNKLIQSG